VKFDDLSGIELDFWVAKAEGFKVQIYTGFGKLKGHKMLKYWVGQGSDWLKVDWSFIGPIVARDKPLISWHGSSDLPTYQVEWYLGDFTGDKVESESQDLLLAFKRCIAKRKYGEEVPNAA